MDVEEKLSRDLAQRKALQVSMLKAKFASRKKDKMKKLREKQEAEKAQVFLLESFKPVCLLKSITQSCIMT